MTGPPIAAAPPIVLENEFLRVEFSPKDGTILGLKNGLGILMVNLRSQNPEPVQLAVDPVAYGLPNGEYTLRQVSANKTTYLGTFQTRRKIHRILPPRNIVLIEAVYCLEKGNIE